MLYKHIISKHLVQKFGTVRFYFFFKSPMHREVWVAPKFRQNKLSLWAFKFLNLITFWWATEEGTHQFRAANTSSTQLRAIKWLKGSAVNSFHYLPPQIGCEGRFEEGAEQVFAFVISHHILVGQVRLQFGSPLNNCLACPQPLTAFSEGTFYWIPERTVCWTCKSSNPE